MRKKISVVTPCFEEVSSIRECYERVRNVFQSQLKNYDYEHTFCDNFSTDGTLQVLKEIAKKDKNVKIISNSRNFGPLNSMFNGVMASSGDAVIPFLPADCQDPPEVLKDFVTIWERGTMVVFGIRTNRQDPRLLRFIRARYYQVVNRFANIYIPRDVGEFTLIDKAVVSSLRQVEDYYPYLRGLIANAGFSTGSVAYTWAARSGGKSKLNLYSLVDIGLNGLISFTNIPMRLMMVSGAFTALISSLYAVVVFLGALLGPETSAPPGITTLIVAVFFFSGLILLSLGVLGEYISAIHFQVRKRPLVIEIERINF